MTEPNRELAETMIANCRKELIRKLGADAPLPTVILDNDDYRGSGRVVVTGWKFNHNGLDLGIEVSSSQKELEALNEVPDLVEVFMERPVDAAVSVRILTIAVVEPSTESNHALIKVIYSLDHLCKLFGIKPLAEANADTKIGLIREKCPEIGIRADWHNAKAKNFHYSGGVGARQGSGPIRLRRPTVKDFADTEVVRNTNWNLAELLGPDRPVFERFPKLLENGKQIGTSLEVEAEYIVDPDRLPGIINVMDGLLGDELLRIKLGIHSLGKEVKKTVDHYYDLPDFPLLKEGFVLRHRTATNDPSGTWLLAVKGRQVGEPGRQIRLTAQADLNGVLATPDALQAFLADQGADNPVARTLRDALGIGFDELISANAPKRLFTLEATRTRYKMTLADSVIVEFSADDSTAKSGDNSARLYGFEFGLAHPGLYVDPGTASSGGNMSGPGDSRQASTGVHGSQAAPPAFSRTYHVPLDLHEQSLFTKPDFVRFHKLVDEVIDTVLGLDRAKLKIGGDKGRQAARMLHIIG